MSIPPIIYQRYYLLNLIGSALRKITAVDYHQAKEREPDEPGPLKKDAKRSP